MSKKNVAKNVVVIGTQWGDEGKGKIVDWLTDNAQGVVRFQGGHNAGHTLVIKGQKTALQLIPSGIMREGVACYIGNGVVVSVPSAWPRDRQYGNGGLPDIRTDNMTSALFRCADRRARPSLKTRCSTAKPSAWTVQSACSRNKAIYCTIPLFKRAALAARVH